MKLPPEVMAITIACVQKGLNEVDPRILEAIALFIEVSERCSKAAKQSDDPEVEFLRCFESKFVNPSEPLKDEVEMV